MKQYILIPIENHTVNQSFFNKLTGWAKTVEDDIYVIEYPRKIERDRTILQNSAYWGRTSWMVKNIGEYSKRGYHAIFMELAGYGEYYKTKNGDIRFLPDSLTNVKISQIDNLIIAQEHHVADRNEDLPIEAQVYLPSIEEFKVLRGQKCKQ